jgi:hypothetical protein
MKAECTSSSNFLDLVVEDFANITLNAGIEAVTMKITIFRIVMPCSSERSRHFRAAVASVFRVEE